MALFVAVCVAAQSPLRRVDRPTPCDFVAAPGDLDGDGDVDGFEWNADGGLTGRVVLNDGHGAFVAAAATGLPFLGATPLAALSIADYDGDGYGDVLALGTGTPFDGLYLGGAALAFTPGPALPSMVPTLTAGSHAAADCDGDGDLDVVVGRRVLSPPPYVSAPPVWYRNMGGGVFVAAASGALGAVAAGYLQTLVRDFDGDGDVDALFAGGGAGADARAYFNDGTGSFAAATPDFLSSMWFPGAALGDFDGDGLFDVASVAAAPFGPAALEISFGTAGGFAAPVATFGAVHQVPFPLLAVDLDGDGAHEVLSWKTDGQSYSLGALKIDVAGVATPFGPRFGHDRGFSAAADLDGDGDQDVLRLGGGFLMNDGAGGLVEIAAAGDPAAKANWGLSAPVAYVDLGGDGLVDTVGRGLQTAFANGEGGFFFQAGSSPIAPYAGAATRGYGATFDRDQDGDGDFVVVAATAGGPAAAFLYDVSGWSVAPIGAPQGVPLPSRSSVAAFDGDVDGDLDVCVGVEGGPVFGSVPAGTLPMRFLENLGAAGLAASVGIGVPAWTTDLARGDFDGDGLIDLLQLNGGPADDSVVFLARPGGPTAVAQVGLIGAFAAVGDLDFDGDADAVVDGAVYFNQGGLLVPGPVLPSALRNYAALVDLDLDGDLDLLETPATVLLNLGGGVFGAPESALPRNSGWRAEQGARSCAADVDFDGDLDVVAPGPVVVTNVRRHLAHAGVPRLGRPSGVRLFGTPGGACGLFASPVPANVPMPPYGVALLDPGTAIGMAVGLFAPAGAPNAGEATMPFVVPNAPSLAGLAVYWQAVDVGSAAFTNRLTTVVLAF